MLFISGEIAEILPETCFLYTLGQSKHHHADLHSGRSEFGAFFYVCRGFMVTRQLTGKLHRPLADVRYCNRRFSLLQNSIIDRAMNKVFLFTG